MELRLYPNADHPDIAGSYIDIGNAYYGLGEYEKAIAHTTKKHWRWNCGFIRTQTIRILRGATTTSGTLTMVYANTKRL